MQGWMIVLLVAVILVAITIVMYIIGNKLQKKQTVQREQMAAAAQPVTMMIIDKKYIKMKDAKLPKAVVEQTPKRYQNSKLPIVKAKIGPQIMSLICDDGIFDEIPTKGEVKAMVSGIYIVSVKNIRGTIEAPIKKKTFGAKLRSRQKKYQSMIKQEEAEKAAKQKAKQQEAIAKKIK